MYYQSKKYCPVLVAQEGSAIWGNTLATALLHDQNRTIPFGLIVLLYTLPSRSDFTNRAYHNISQNPKYIGKYLSP